MQEQRNASQPLANSSPAGRLEESFQNPGNPIIQLIPVQTNCLNSGTLATGRKLQNPGNPIIPLIPDRCGGTTMNPSFLMKMIGIEL
jgi:hypothetical protein